MIFTINYIITYYIYIIFIYCEFFHYPFNNITIKLIIFIYCEFFQYPFNNITIKIIKYNILY